MRCSLVPGKWTGAFRSSKHGILQAGVLPCCLSIKAVTCHGVGCYAKPATLWSVVSNSHTWVLPPLGDVYVPGASGDSAAGGKSGGLALLRSSFIRQFMNSSVMMLPWPTSSTLKSSMWSDPFSRLILHTPPSLMLWRSPTNSN